MFSFSYTAPRITEAEKEEEFAGMPEVEKDDVMNDVYGRNADETEAKYGREISPHELDAFYEALEDVPIQYRLETLAAMIRCPELVKTETDPCMFLRYAEFDPHKAANRFAAYWKIRVEMFGDKAFLPMTLTGAYADDVEVLQMMEKYPLFRTILPNDCNGRTVILIQTSHHSDEYNKICREAKVRYAWYNAHEAMKRESTIFRGVVGIHLLSGKFKINLFDRIKEKKLSKIFLDCIPFKIRAVHYIFTEKYMQDLMLSVIRVFLTREMRQRIICHVTNSNSRESLAEKISQYGFSPEGLTPIMGGTFHPNLDWLQHQLKLEIEQQDQQQLESANKNHFSIAMNSKNLQQGCVLQ
mmetsp:Transcript_1770/g.2477  ORF Transcript_1770/g.2477 Transcript_1770/m.2477 type:complete len:355 (+) Transcript_1770:263-1327(+)